VCGARSETESERMKLVWGRRARRDLRELIAYIAEDSIQAAELVASRILKSAGFS